MAKRPTPKKRRAKSSGRAQHSEYQRKQIRKLKNKANSPFSVKAESKNKKSKTLKGITKVKA
ncbi:MAG: hypothetical protein HOG89_00910 [Candidatus Peribacter sp.]|nr:hypothetical protein [Candidatus Peribacter sp.]MBT4392918.1 hypothetical protein [Candidatus Peribacter sp.]MBT4600978.1 hypothetical protein [Candidatus Peribacter sp.]MBT5149020.1 hypothetical protein [Candidatus Peribacter sp.]MBT5637344.1 hypothetical protein [Candidatus Peribacter sp.]